MLFRLVLLVAVVMSPALGQSPTPNPTPPPTAFGIYIDAEGALRHRAKDAQAELARMRSLKSAKKPGLYYLSLSKLLGEVKEDLEQGRAIGDEARYLHGLTQVQYVFVYPEEHDLVLAGPAEPVDARNPMLPLGKFTGRPVMQLDDLVVALRMANARRPQPFGCSIDPAPHAVEKGQRVANEYMNRSRAELMEALAKALGPQPIRIFGVADDTRYGFACVAADYQLKRYFLGLDQPPVAGLGNPVDNSRAAGNAYWFEMCYEPILVSKEGDAFELRGPRLMLKAGQLPFDEKGATPRAKAWAKTFSEKMPQIAAAMPLIADLQNLADLSLVAQLIRRDRLSEKAGVELEWLVEGSKYRVARVPVAKTTDTLVNITNGSVTAGGVMMSVGKWLELREEDRGHRVEEVRNGRK